MAGQARKRQTRQYVQVVDQDTGEVLSSYWTDRLQPPVGGRPHFFRVYRANLRQLVQMHQLSLREAGLLFQMMAFLQWGGPYLVDGKTGRNLSESDVADLLGISRSTVNAILRSLNQKGLVSLVKRGNGRPNHIMLNSHLLFYGNRLKNPHDHAVFDDVGWQPQRPIFYDTFH